jgi:hypothetical protein
MFGSFGAIFLYGTNSDSNDLPGRAQLYLLFQLEDYQQNVAFQKNGAPPY